MKLSASFSIFIVLLIILLQMPAPSADLPADLYEQEQQAFVAAVNRVAPSVLQIETVGGMERVGAVLFGTGPTTGLIISADGYLVSSLFNFANQPTAIFVRLPDGVRKTARIVAIDYARMLVLLKIDVEKPLPVCEFATKDDIRIGYWAIAVGRTFDFERPNMAVGIISALNRIWGKAIQTDAAVSPNNYGGPLIDIHGRVLGILVPLSPDGSDELSGVEWYDSGIGFAIPMTDILQILPRLKNGENLYPGILGADFAGQSIYNSRAVIKNCVENGPAAKAGLKPGDIIIEIDGHKVNYLSDVKTGIARHYAGDKIPLVVMRNNQQLHFTVELTRPVAVKPKD